MGIFLNIEVYGEVAMNLYGNFGGKTHNFNIETNLSISLISDLNMNSWCVHVC